MSTRRVLLVPFLLLAWLYVFLFAVHYVLAYDGDVLSPEFDMMPVRSRSS